MVNKIQAAMAMVRRNEMQWHRACAKAVAALESGENYERHLREADAYAVATRALQAQIKDMIRHDLLAYAVAA